MEIANQFGLDQYKHWGFVFMKWSDWFDWSVLPCTVFGCIQQNDLPMCVPSTSYVSIVVRENTRSRIALPIVRWSPTRAHGLIDRLWQSHCYIFIFFSILSSLPLIPPPSFERLDPNHYVYILLPYPNSHLLKFKRIRGTSSASKWSLEGDVRVRLTTVNVINLSLKIRTSMVLQSTD